ncbi:hypothetical protein BHE74_00020547 [Ensete ventricosum]|nr:hypothetical protein BHE74_00020547 [Ensete ventricosum]
MTIPARSKSGDGNRTWPGRDYGSLTYGLALFGLIGAAAATIAVMAIPLSYLFFGVLLSTIGIQERWTVEKDHALVLHSELWLSKLVYSE